MLRKIRPVGIHLAPGIRDFNEAAARMLRKIVRALNLLLVRRSTSMRPQHECCGRWPPPKLLADPPNERDSRALLGNGQDMLAPSLICLHDVKQPVEAQAFLERE